VELSGYKSMWLVAMFDLPTDTAASRKAYMRFRKILIKDGFTMMQYSVYIRHCASDENADVHEERVVAHLPPDGEVRLVKITDKQYERMRVFWGKMRKPTEQAPRQLEMF